MPPPHTDSPRSPRPVADAERFLLRLARALHEAGAPSHRIEDAMDGLAPRLGVEGRFFSTPTSIFVSFGDEVEARTTLLRVEPADVNLERMVHVDQVLADVHAGRLDLPAAVARLDAIAAAPSRYGRAVTLAAFALAAATVARFLGGGGGEVLAAALIGAQTGGFALLVARGREAARVFEWVAAFAASVGALGWALAFGPLVAAIAAVAGLIVLLPGLTLTVALTELATRHLVSGTARLAGTGLTFLAIGFGLGLGSRLAPLLGGAIVPAPLAPLPAWTEGLALALAPFALVVLFRARPRDVGIMAISGIAAYAVQRYGGRVAGPEIGMLAAAFTAGVVANLYARLRRRPAAVAVVPAVILLVPGSLGVSSVAALVAQELVPGVRALITLFVLAGALAAGILLANLVVSPRRAL